MSHLATLQEPVDDGPDDASGHHEEGNEADYLRYAALGFLDPLVSLQPIHHSGGVLFLNTRLAGGNRPCQLDPTATVDKIQSALPGCGRPRFGGAPGHVGPASFL